MKEIFRNNIKPIIAGINGMIFFAVYKSKGINIVLIIALSILITNQLFPKND